MKRLLRRWWGNFRRLFPLRIGALILLALALIIVFLFSPNEGDFLLYPAGLVAMLVTRRFQRIGDLVAGTMVVIVDRGKGARPIDVAPPTAEEAQALPPSLALDADERAALELFLRRKKLGPAREHELAEMLAPTLARRHRVWHTDPVRLLAILYDRARTSGRSDGPPSSRGGAGWL